jgi:hypothetical protein
MSIIMLELIYVSGGEDVKLGETEPSPHCFSVKGFTGRHKANYVGLLAVSELEVTCQDIVPV